MAREKRITVRLTKEQFEHLEELRGNVPRSEFLYLILLDYMGRERELEKELRRIHDECINKCEFLRELRRELSRVGVNVNQIARALNVLSKGKKLPAKEKKALLDLTIETLSLVQELLSKLAEVRLGYPQEGS
jgi:Arc/MetJ-type ribon-helix-helix transcriptional regulator